MIASMTHGFLLSRRAALALGAGALALPLPTFAASKRPVLVELFTSQGCSSCPPADKFAGELVSDPDAMVVSLNVDYWDYLGWRDTLAKPEYSQRQYDYARQRGDGSVYTPQMVVDGTTHAVGSKPTSVRELIADAQSKPLLTQISLTLSAKEISVSIDKAEYSGEATLWLMSIVPQVAQKIERGENAGEDIVYYNVVRNLVPAAMWKGEAYTGSWMKNAIMTENCKSCIAVLQDGKVGPVLGIARA
jgi:hypothetical protein